MQNPTPLQVFHKAGRFSVPLEGSFPHSPLVDETLCMWNPSNVDTACLEYRGIYISKAFNTSRRGNVYSCCWGLWSLHSRAPICCMLVRKTNQRLVLCIPALLKCPVFESISDAGQSQGTKEIGCNISYIVGWILHHVMWHNVITEACHVTSCDHRSMSRDIMILHLSLASMITVPHQRQVL